MIYNHCYVYNHWYLCTYTYIITILSDIYHSLYLYMYIYAFIFIYPLNTMPGTEQRAIAISVNSLCYSKFPFQYCFYESFFFFLLSFLAAPQHGVPRPGVISEPPFRPTSQLQQPQIPTPLQTLPILLCHSRNSSGTVFDITMKVCRTVIWLE